MSSKLRHHLEPIRAYLRTKPVLKAELFGICTRGEWGPETAVEFLVTPVSGVSRIELFAMEGDLENLLGRRVHVLLRTSVETMTQGHARDFILSSSIPVYEASKAGATSASP